MITSISLQHASINGGNVKSISKKDIINLHLFKIKGERYKDFPFFLLDANINLIVKGDFVDDLCEILFDSNDCKIATVSFLDTCKDGTERAYDFEFDFRNITLQSDCGAELKGLQLANCYTKMFNAWETEINFADLAVTDAVIQNSTLNLVDGDVVYEIVVCKFQSDFITLTANLNASNTYLSEQGQCLGVSTALGNNVLLTTLDEDYGNFTGVSYTPTGIDDNRIVLNNISDAFQIQTNILKWCVKDRFLRYDIKTRNLVGNNVQGYNYQNLEAETTLERYTAIIPSASPTPAGWFVVYDNGTTKKIWFCPLSDENGNFITDYSQGRSLSDVLTYLATETVSCIECVKSQFFGIGDVNYSSDAFSNDAYSYAYQYLQNISVHTISDVIYPNADTPSGDVYYVVSLKAFLDDLETLFNIRYAIDDDNCLVIEHLSFFQSQGTKDFTSCTFGRAYDLQTDNTKLAKFEKWQMLERSDNRDFTGEPIEYACNLGSSTISKRMQVIATDLQFLAKKEAGESGTDKQFVLIARDADNFVLSGTGILTGQALLNEPLSISRLHEKLHRYGRLQSNGIMNTQQTDFETVTPTLQSSQLTCKNCCDDIEENAEYILPINENAKFSRLSKGILQSYELDLYYNSLTADFLHTIEA